MQYISGIVLRLNFRPTEWSRSPSSLRTPLRRSYSLRYILYWWPVFSYKRAFAVDLWPFIYARCLEMLNIQKLDSSSLFVCFCWPYFHSHVYLLFHGDYVVSDDIYEAAPLLTYAMAYIAYSSALHIIFFSFAVVSNGSTHSTTFAVSLNWIITVQR